MFIEVEMPIYECSKCGSRDVQVVSGRNGHYYDHWRVCNNCGHSDKPDRTVEAVTAYETKKSDVVKF